MIEYRESRCCMCPNSGKPQIPKCPVGPGKNQETDCRFVKTYVDERGWKYRVMQGLGESNYKARYNKPGKSAWKCMAKMEWKNTFDEAQADLNAMAKQKGWQVVILDREDIFAEEMQEALQYAHDQEASVYGKDFCK